MAAAPPPPAWEAALFAVAAAERGAAGAWEALVPLMLAAYPTRAAVEAARKAIEAALGRAFFTPPERELLAQSGVRGLAAEVQRAKTLVLAKMRACWMTLVDKWLFPESATVMVNGVFWRRNMLGHGVHAVERALPQAAPQPPPLRAGVPRRREAEPSMLEHIAAFGVQPPSKVWELHDRGPITAGCGGWRQFRIIIAAPSSYGKSWLARHLILNRNAAMTADERDTGPIQIDNIGVFSNTGAGWEDIPPDQVRAYSPELVEEIFGKVEAAALAAKARGDIPVPRVFVFDDVAGLRGVDRDPIIDRIFTAGRHLNISVFLLGQSPRNLVNPTRKNNASLYFFGNFFREPGSNKPFADAAGVSLPDYNAWSRSHFGNRHGYVFGCMPEEAVEAGDTELPFCLAAVPEADKQHAEPEPEPERPPNAGAGFARPEPAVPDARAIADASLADGRIGREMLVDDDGDGIDYAAEERRLNSVEAMLMGVRIADMPPTCPTCKRSCSCPV